MRTILEIKKALENFPDTAVAYAYEGEVSGLVIVDGEGDSRKELGFIPCHARIANEPEIQVNKSE